MSLITLKLQRMVLLFLVILLIVAGCGLNSSQTACDIAVNEENRKIIVAVDTAYPPFAYRDQNTGEYTGFDIDIIKAIAAIKGWEYEIRSMDYVDILPAVECSAVDAAISAIVIVDKPNLAINYSYPYYVSAQSVAIKVDNERINSAGDLEGKRLGVKVASAGAMEACKIGGASIMCYKDINSALTALKEDQVDAVVGDFSVLAYYVKQGNDDIKIMADLRTGESMGIAVPEADAQLLEEINEALVTLKNNGKYQQLYKNWFNDDPPEKLPVVPEQNDLPPGEKNKEGHVS